MSANDEPVVWLRGVTLDVGGTRVLDGIELRIRAGERVALVGPSGAGKTTLLMIVNGTVVPTGGDVRVLGGTPSATGRVGRRARSRVGTIYQHLYLAGALQAVHNVNAGRLPHWSTLRAAWSLARPQLGEAVHLLDRVGIGHKARERTERLSGGEQQRVAIARVLAQQPDVVLADEPIASLDPARAREMLDLLCGLATDDGRTLLVSLHAFDLARSHCDRVVGLRAGRVVFDAPAHAVSDEMADALYRVGARD